MTRELCDDCGHEFRADENYTSVHITNSATGQTSRLLFCRQYWHRTLREAGTLAQIWRFQI